MFQSMPLEDTIEERISCRKSAAAAAVELPVPLHQLNHNHKATPLPRFQLWPAATTLLTLLDRHRTCHSSNAATPLSSLFNTRLRLLELGSGTGVVGIAAAALLGANVTVTDLPYVLPNLQFNVAANTEILELHGGAVEVAALQWGGAKHIEAIDTEYDVILGSVQCSNGSRVGVTVYQFVRKWWLKIEI